MLGFCRVFLWWGFFCLNRPQMFTLPLRLALTGFDVIFLEAIKEGEKSHSTFKFLNSVLLLPKQELMSKMLCERQNSPDNTNITPGYFMKMYKYPWKADSNCCSRLWNDLIFLHFLQYNLFNCSRYF